ncbi:MAG: cysteine synthase B, partial [Gammaproteobacteria bacterium]
MSINNKEFHDLESTVGNTPLVRLKRIGSESGNVLLAKLEGNNPA